MLQAAPAFAELGDGDSLHDLDHSFPHLFHDASDGAARFIRAGALFVKPLADTTDRCQSTFDMPDDYGERDFFRPPGEAVTPSHPAFALDDACRPQVVEDLFEETLGNVLLFGNRLNPNHGLVVVEAQNEQGSQCIFTSNRKFHAAKIQSTVKNSRISLYSIKRPFSAIKINLIISIDIIEIKDILDEIEFEPISMKPTADIKSAPEQGKVGSDSWLDVVRRQVGSLNFGVVQIVVHGARVVQIERTEKIRFENPIAVSNPGD